jgi:general secretion pathway protein A
MVLPHFKLREQPFGVTPNPRYIYASAAHREALSSILYGVQAGLGFIALTGPPGTGKTTILFEAMRRLSETNRIAFLFQTVSTPADLLRALLIELGVKNAKGSLAEMQAELNEVLVSQSAKGKRLVVAIDEAQNLNHSVLEAIRMLSNFETASHKLMQIILTGQPQLAEKLASPSLLQLRQRISIFGTLRPLTVKETESYIQHRLHTAGYSSDAPLFSESALALVAHYSEGMPRNINNICFNALSFSYALDRRQIDSDVIREVVSDLGMSRPQAPVRAQDAVFYERRNLAEISRPPVKSKSTTFRPPSKIAVCALLLSLLWLHPQRLEPSFTGQTALPHSSDNSSLPTTKQSRTLEPQTKLIEVRRGQTLSEICALYLGAYRSKSLQEIVKINRVIHDPDHIKAGQRIYVPIYNPVSAKVGRASREQLALYVPGGEIP